MYFRSDGFVDAGGRFSEMPGKVKYGAVTATVVSFLFMIFVFIFADFYKKYNK